MDWSSLYSVLLFVQRGISFLGVMVILSGVLLALWEYFYNAVTANPIKQGTEINAIRLRLGRILILGLEFIIAADLIGTTTTPDYYALGILVIVVVIRTILSFTLNKELIALSKETSE
jgi:uncharacterized membrane protein